MKLRQTRATLQKRDGVKDNTPRKRSLEEVQFLLPELLSLSPLIQAQRQPSAIYTFHVENLRELEIALANVGRLAKEEIATRDSQNSLRSLLRLYTFLIGAWAECRLKKLLHEEYGFTATERMAIESARSQHQMWTKVVEHAFRKHYHIPHGNLDCSCLGDTKAAYYDQLLASLDDELKIVIEIRNKLAHGQWRFPLNRSGTSVQADKERLISRENLMTLQIKYRLIGKIADVVHDLVVSPATFERDFSNHFALLSQARIDLNRRSYEKYRDKLINARERARMQRKNS